MLIALLLPALGTAHPRPRGNVGPLRQVSRLSPLGPLSSCGNFPRPNEVVFLNSEVEPFVAVNPTNERNIVAFWQQDRWSLGGARANVAGVTHDRGRHWEIVPVPGLTDCTGGTFERASDPWLAFAPDGTLHQISLVLTGFVLVPGNRNALAVSRSTDGGLTWTDPILIVEDADSFAFNDKQSLTADPADPRFLYAAWERVSFEPTALFGPSYFTRTADGGRTWETARPIYDPGPNNQTLGNLVVVLPSGKLINFFSELIFAAPDGTFLPDPIFNISFLASDDRGLSWTPNPTTVVSRVPAAAVTPDELMPIRDASLIFDAAVDRRTGAIYVVWQDEGAAGPSVFLSVSKDEGQHWTAPIRVDQTPQRPAHPLRGQAFLPQVRVTRDGTVGVLYYDFRRDDDQAEWADVFLVRCRSRCDRRRRWRREVRLTKESFDYRQAPGSGDPPATLFLGDYVGLAAGRRTFTALFAQSFHMIDPASGFFRQVGRRRPRW